MMTENAVNAFWMRTANVGDCLTPFVLERLTGRPVKWTDRSPKWLAAGSILHEAHAGDTLCGVGSFEHMPAPNAADVRILTVRGPLTAAKLGTTLPMYGDVGLLLPGVYWEPKPVTHVWGVIPHYVDEPEARLAYPDAYVISVNLSVTEFVDAVRSCRYVASSSLHGLIVAEAYGVPAVRVRFATSNQIRDFDYKHRDYYEGTGRQLPAAVLLRKARRPEVVLSVVKHAAKLSDYVRYQLKEVRT